MKTNLPLFLLCNFWCCVIFSQYASAWSDGDYEKYDYKRFEKLQIVGRRIDMDRIDYPLINAAVFYETNRQRAVNGRSALRHSPSLEKVAAGYSRDMVKYNFFSHKSPVWNKRTPRDRIKSEGIKYGYSGENIIDIIAIEYDDKRGIYTPGQNGGSHKYFSYELQGKPILNRTYLGLGKKVVDDFMNSPGHRKNILNQNYIYLGVGSLHYKEPEMDNLDRFKITQDFSEMTADKRSGHR